MPSGVIRNIGRGWRGAHPTVAPLPLCASRERSLLSRRSDAWTATASGSSGSVALSCAARARAGALDGSDGVSCGGTRRVCRVWQAGAERPERERDDRDEEEYEQPGAEGVADGVGGEVR